MARKQTFISMPTFGFGISLLPAVVLVILFVATVSYVVADYRRHKRPLVEADPNTHYTLTHHVRLVTLPLIWYRISFSLHNKHGKGLVRKF